MKCGTLAAECGEANVVKRGDWGNCNGLELGTATDKNVIGLKWKPAVKFSIRRGTSRSSKSLVMDTNIRIQCASLFVTINSNTFEFMRTLPLLLLRKISQWFPSVRLSWTFWTVYLLKESLQLSVQGGKVQLLCFKWYYYSEKPSMPNLW